MLNATGRSKAFCFLLSLLVQPALAGCTTNHTSATSPSGVASSGAVGPGASVPQFPVIPQSIEPYEACPGAVVTVTAQASDIATAAIIVKAASMSVDNIVQVPPNSSTFSATFSAPTQIGTYSLTIEGGSEGGISTEPKVIVCP